MRNDLQKQEFKIERYIINKTQQSKITKNKTNMYPLNCHQRLQPSSRIGTIENSSFIDRTIHSRNSVRWTGEWVGWDKQAAWGQANSHHSIDWQGVIKHTKKELNEFQCGALFVRDQMSTALSSNCQFDSDKGLKCSRSMHSGTNHRYCYHIFLFISTKI
jgi:hypothetical protein